MTFEEAQEKVKTLSSKPDNDQLLKLYALYKQGSSGDNLGAAPENAFDFVAKAKHEAWAALRGKTMEDAQNEYISYVEKLLSEDQS
ncbi:acyl-CoA-binding protein [Hyphobacterium sp. CCMP332]|nr:acyl-CoA-binding protein [Hyphobacterium sp. CCMP332]